MCCLQESITTPLSVVGRWELAAFEPLQPYRPQDTLDAHMKTHKTEPEKYYTACVIGTFGEMIKKILANSQGQGCWHPKRSPEALPGRELLQQERFQGQGRQRRVWRGPRGLQRGEERVPLGRRAGEVAEEGGGKEEED